MARTPGKPLTRRAWAALVGAGAAGVVLGSAGCEGPVALGDDLPGLDLEGVGAAVLEPTADALVVSVWAARGGDVVIEARAGGAAIARAALALAPGIPGSARLAGLAPATAHEVWILGARGRDALAGPCRARTAPADDDPRPVRLAVGADLDASPAFDGPLVDHLIAAAPELYLSLGDMPYADNGPPAQTLDEYRARHAALRLSRHGRRLLEGVGVRAIYDDHEFRNDWDAMFAAAEPARLRAAMRAWDEFFPIPGAPPAVRYRRARWGAHVEVFLLDTRRFRSANAAPDDAAKTMLGAPQLAWLVDGVRASAATFKLVCTSVPLGYGTGLDHWAGFTTERAALLDALVGVPGVLFLAGDQHLFAAHRHARGVREIQVGPVARGVHEPGPPAEGVLFRSARPNVGLLDVTGDQLVVTALGEAGEAFYAEALTPAQLTPA